MSERRIAVLGFGEIARTAVEAARDRNAGLVLAGVLLRPGSVRPHGLPEDCIVAYDVDSLLAARVDEVFECASHEAVEVLAPRILRAGVPVSIVSTGALTQPGLIERLLCAADAGRSTLSILPGAVAGLEALASARLIGLESVCHRIVKPRSAWAGTDAEALMSSFDSEIECEFFRGSSRDAAARYPRNANATAAVALAGIGFDRTETVLVAGCEDGRNVHELTASGAFGTLSVKVVGKPMRRNPKTSMLAALSVARAMLNPTERIAV